MAVLISSFFFFVCVERTEQQNKSRIQALELSNRPHPNGGDGINGDCCLYACLMRECRPKPSSFLLVCSSRADYLIFIIAQTVESLAVSSFVRVSF